VVAMSPRRRTRIDPPGSLREASTMDGALSKLLKPPTSQREAPAYRSVTKPVVRSESAPIFSEAKKEKGLACLSRNAKRHWPALATPSQR
jgi:hypothetical protein